MRRGEKRHIVYVLWVCKVNISDLTLEQITRRWLVQNMRQQSNKCPPLRLPKRNILLYSVLPIRIN